MPDVIPIVSVCVQTYNHENYIVKCLESILMQKTNFPFEIILGEDLSSDKTREICIEYKDKFPDKIKLFLRNREDVIYIEGKPTGRFNFTENLKSCRGKYIAICEGDDFWTDENKLQKQVDFLEVNKEVVGCFHNSFVVNDKDEVIEKQYFKNLEKKSYNQEECLKTLKSAYATCSLVFRRNLIFNQISIYRDFISDFFIELLITQHGKLVYIDENMSAYRLHSGGIWQGSPTLHNNKVILRRYKFLYSIKDFRLKYKEYLKRKVLDYHKKVLQDTTSTKERIRFVFSRMKYLNYSPEYIYDRVRMSIHYRTKTLFKKQ